MSENLENKPNLAKAIIAVMKAVKSIDKNTTVGSGNSSYKGVSDKDVKLIIGGAMAENGLCILPLSVDPVIHIHRWEEEKIWNGQSQGMKQKQSVFTEARTKYLLLHESGESIVLEGYGHGNDSMDKSAGKATTYALKYTLLYAFLTPTGDIDDADNTHSNDHQPPPPAQQPQPQKQQKPKLVKDDDNWKKITKAIGDGTLKTLQGLKVEVSEELQKELQKMIDKKKPKLVKDSDEWKKAVGYIEEGKLTKIEQLTKQFQITKVLQKEIQQMIDDKVNNDALNEQVAKEQAQENQDEDGRLPNLTETAFKEALGKTKDEIIDTMNTHRMSQDMRDQLTAKLK